MKKNKNLTVILALMASVALYFYMRRKKATTTTTADILPGLPVSEPTLELTPLMRPVENLQTTTEPVLEISELDYYESEQPTEFNDFDVM